MDKRKLLRGSLWLSVLLHGGGLGLEIYYSVSGSLRGERLLASLIYFIVFLELFRNRSWAFYPAILISFLEAAFAFVTIRSLPFLSMFFLVYGAIFLWLLWVNRHLYTKAGKL